MLPIYIIAGGKSSRFGSDKARADVNGEPLLKRIARVLTPVASRISVVADSPGKYDDLGLHTLSDVRPNLGPMGGLLTALNDLETPAWLLLCSCDFVTINASWVDTLANARTPEIQAIAFKGERIEPLFALYHSSLLHTIERRINAGELSPSHLIQAVPNALLPLPAIWPELAHVNTREELARAHTPNCSK